MKQLTWKLKASAIDFGLSASLGFHDFSNNNLQNKKLKKIEKTLKQFMSGDLVCNNTKMLRMRTSHLAVKVMTKGLGIEVCE